MRRALKAIESKSTVSPQTGDISSNHMVNTFYPIENNAITNKLLLRYKTRLKSPEQEKIT